jgi:hypothetical protein
MGTHPENVPLLIPTAIQAYMVRRGSPQVLRLNSPQAPLISRIPNYRLIIRKEYCLNQDFQDGRLYSFWIPPPLPNLNCTLEIGTNLKI